VSGVVLDTSAYSAFKRGHADAVLAVQRAGRLIMPIVVLAELLAGFASGTRTKQNRAELDAFRASPRVSVVPLVETTAECYAAIHAALRSAGTPIATSDLWIAASTMEHGAELVTLDRAFLLVPQIRVSCLVPV
jgi:tRNA(fMet)-specific endonuclease VapC